MVDLLLLTIWSTLSTPTDKNASWSPARSSRPSPGRMISDISHINISKYLGIKSMICLKIYHIFPRRYLHWKLIWWNAHLPALPEQSPAHLLPERRVHLSEPYPIQCCVPNIPKYRICTFLKSRICAFWRNKICPGTWYRWSSPIFSRPLRELGPFLSWKNRNCHLHGTGIKTNNDNSFHSQ